MADRLRIGTRGSRLALAQVELVRPLLAKIGFELEPVIIKTSGDQGLRELRGAFVREIQVALQNGEVDLALHCLKDLPTDEVAGLGFVAYLEREDPRDALIVRDPLPTNARVGTGSARRTAQLRLEHPDWTFLPLVGNVDTRLNKLSSGDYDAIVLALAGLRRLGLDLNAPLPGLSVQALPFEVMVPAPGQGVLVLETRLDHPAWDRLRSLNHLLTEQASRAERAMLRAFGGGCSVPIGALGRFDPDFRLVGFVNGTFAEILGDPEAPEASGQRLAEAIRERGGGL